MRVPAVAASGTQAIAATAVYAQGTFGQAAAAMLALRGCRVNALGCPGARTWQCDVYMQNKARYSSAVLVEGGGDFAGVRDHDTVVIAVPATSYGAACEELAPHLKSGQTLFILQAAFGASLEFAYLLGRKRSDLSVSVVEVGSPFSAAFSDGNSLVIKGLRDSLLIAGGSLNATRAGLSAGGSIFPSLVPASNLLERGFANMERWLETAALVFEVLNSRPSRPLTAVLSGFSSELLALAKAYGLNRLPQPALPANGVATAPDAVEALGERIIEDFVILSSLARLRYVNVPLLDSLIDISSAITACDLRQEARQLSDLGLIGMDAQEIIEHVSA